MGNIRIIGPRNSGKTTYLAALAYQPNKDKRKHKYLQVQALNDDTRLLADKAESIILQGASLEPSITHFRTIYDMPVYSFNIEIKHFLRKENIMLVVRDYPGEIFDDLENGTSNKLSKEFIDECLAQDVSGCLILLSEWKHGTDKSYSRILDQFIQLINRADRGKDLRLAVVMGKCERGELWPGRLDPEIDLFDIHLPETKSILKRGILHTNLHFYASSTFGVLGRNDPRPNRIEEWGTDGRNSVLREPERWRPYGLLSPLYWLSTGKKMGFDI